MLKHERHFDLIASKTNSQAKLIHPTDHILWNRTVRKLIKLTKVICFFFGTFICSYHKDHYNIYDTRAWYTDSRNLINLLRLERIWYLKTRSFLWQFGAIDLHVDSRRPSWYICSVYYPIESPIPWYFFIYTSWPVTGSCCTNLHPLVKIPWIFLFSGTLLGLAPYPSTHSQIVGQILDVQLYDVLLHPSNEELAQVLLCVSLSLLGNLQKQKQALTIIRITLIGWSAFYSTRNSISSCASALLSFKVTMLARCRAGVSTSAVLNSKESVTLAFRFHAHNYEIYPLANWYNRRYRTCMRVLQGPRGPRPTSPRTLLLSSSSGRRYSKAY